MIPTHIVIHHSASGDDLTFEQIRTFHRDKGWDDIGYHFVISSVGEVFKGRAEDIVGAHALGLNQSSIGICCIGNFEESMPSNEQFQALVALVVDVAGRHGIAADGVIGHCDVTCEERGWRRSSCPGKRLYERLGEIREAVLEGGLK